MTNFEKLKHIGVAEEFLNNYDLDRDVIDYLSWDSLLSGSFMWGNSPEGVDFWSDIANCEPMGEENE